MHTHLHNTIQTTNKKTAGFLPSGFPFILFPINENRIQQPILVTFVQDMERQQMQVHEQMSL